MYQQFDKETREKLELLRKVHDNIASATPIDISETPSQKRDRITRLEADPEEWFKYYFVAYAKAPPAAFHKAATKRVVENPEYFDERNWSRELAKSTRTMMEVLYLSLAGYPALTQELMDKYRFDLQGGKLKKRNIIITSNSFDNAARLLLPYQVILEKNQRIINDYGVQKNLGSWEAGEFITNSGIAFRAIGAGQSPRGTRNEASRPDVILIDDIDTDADCENPDIIEKRWKWIMEALIPTRSISGHLLIIMCGNIIAEDCCVVRAAEYADYVDIINIRDKNEKSSWPEKNSEADIERVLKLISYESQQKEYYNNPMSAGKTFVEQKWGVCPPLESLPFAVSYTDPSSGNKERPSVKSGNHNSRKCTAVVGKVGNDYYIYKVFLDIMGSSKLIDCMYACRDYVGGKTTFYSYIENNSLQDPIYSQVYLPLIYSKGIGHPMGVLGVVPDARQKGEKWFRIEANLEPINRLGHLIFNIAEKDDEHMKRLAAEFKAAKATAKLLDGCDCIEGAKFIIDERAIVVDEDNYSFFPRERSSKYS